MPRGQIMKNQKKKNFIKTKESRKKRRDNNRGRRSQNLVLYIYIYIQLFLKFTKRPSENGDDHIFFKG